MPVLPNLCYTIALDRPGEDVHWRMARLLASSLVRTGWHGRIVAFHNHARPLLGQPLAGVSEVRLEAATNPTWHQTMSWKYAVRDHLDLTGIGKVLFLDCDVIALRDINHLMAGAWDLYVGAEPGSLVEEPFNGYLTDLEMATLHERRGLNAGNLGIRASVYHDVMREWERLHQSPALRPSHCCDQHAWNRLILDTKLRHRLFADGELQYPFLHGATWTSYRYAALVHAASRAAEEKFARLYGLWMDVFGRDAFLKFTATRKRSR
jgi:hypothetical protein